jgi:hypothetical protein
MSAVLTNILRTSRDSIQGLIHQTSPALPLLHWMEYISTSYMILNILRLYT